MTDLLAPPETATRSAVKNPEPPTGESPPVLLAVATVFCAAFTLTGWLLGGGRWSLAFYVLAFLAGGLRTTIGASTELIRLRLNVDLLMILAAVGAAIIGDWIEGAVLLFLFSLSHTLESYAMYRTTRSIDALIQLRPCEASVVRAGGDEARVPIEALRLGDLVRVRPGERFPVDGEVVEGATWADEATLTGESEPIAKAAGDPVFAGTINGQGSVLIRMTRAVADTTLERIVRMVREAQAAKSPTQRFVEWWQGPYVAGVLAASAFVFAGTWYSGHALDVADAFYHAMVMLVVTSPCAVVIGSPAVTLSAIARAARNGVLFKGGVYLEALGDVDAIALDKTGTITSGSPGVTDVWTTEGVEADRLLGLVAAVEARSEHPLAQAVVAEATRRGAPNAGTPADFHAHAGQGVHAEVDGLWVGVGRESLFAAHEFPVPAGVVETARRIREGGQTALMVVLGHGREATGGVIAVADHPRSLAAPAVAALKRLGIRLVIILTGDHARVAEFVAHQVGADEVRSGLLPDEKVIELRRLITAGWRLAMVGDGVNDAPALATAEVGIAMGGAGTDVALEVADVVLMRDDLTALPFAVWLSRCARRRMRQNLAFAFGMIGVLVLSSFFGLPLWLGVIGHEGSTLVVVLNGLRLLWEPPGSDLLARQ